MLRKLLDTWSVVQSPGGLQAVLSARPRSLASFRLTRTLRQLGLDFATVIDGGANVGQFARAAAMTFPNAKIYSFEPLPEVCQTLRSNLADVRRHEALCLALGATPGRAQIHVHSDTQVSSLRTLANSASARAGGSTSAMTTEIEVTTLDAWSTGKQLAGPILLKLDLQGYELEALRGASQFLNQVQSILLETALDPTYEGEPLFEEIWRFLDQQGFSFQRPVNFLSSPTGVIEQMDALFVRRRETVANQ